MNDLGSGGDLIQRKITQVIGVWGGDVEDEVVLPGHEIDPEHFGEGQHLIAEAFDHPTLMRYRRGVT